MIANGVLFKVGFDMSVMSDEDILRQYNPTSKSAFFEEIPATGNLTVTKGHITGEDVKIISYKGDEKVIDPILFSSRCMENAAPKLVKVVPINPEFYLVAYPYYRLELDDVPEDEINDWDIDDEDEEYFELNETIENTVKELGRVTMFFMHTEDTDEAILEKTKEYAEKCFRFEEPELIEGEDFEFVFSDIHELTDEELEKIYGEIIHDDEIKEENNDDNNNNEENDD